MVGFWQMTAGQLIRLRLLVGITRTPRGTVVYRRTHAPLVLPRRARSVLTRVQQPQRRLPGIVWLKPH